ncbi:uncharacterized protein VNE69_06043 [Vairimorpha necatrix]|uniref:Uncharacterized protein n=1 Tax=Vairimorpha necatrix TaxID=6039 RepID=A0AAX4JCU4_9MICR
MNKSGARFSKLKLVYKKAIQEILSVNLDTTNTPDSFYNSTINPIDIKEKVETLRIQLSDLFKRKIKEYDLENKLNTLDLLIKDNQDVGDINDEGYIKEILESYLVEDKLKLIEYCNEKTKEIEQYNEDLEKQLKTLEEEYEQINKECLYNESKVEKLIENMKNVYKIV